MKQSGPAQGETAERPGADEFAPLVGRIRPRLGLSHAEGSGENYLPATEVAASVRAAAGTTALRQAAVALVLRENAGRAELLVIKRAERDDDHWSGHLALPGGRRDPEDSDLRATAVRETFEEVGIPLNEEGGEVLGGLEVVRPQSPLAPQIEVWPYVAVAPRAYHLPAGARAPRELVLSREVAAAFWLPVAVLRERGRSEVFSLVFGGRRLKWPAYPSAHGPIWGITERILTDFLRLAARPPRPPS